MGRRPPPNVTASVPCRRTKSASAAVSTNSRPSASRSTPSVPLASHVRCQHFRPSSPVAAFRSSSSCVQSPLVTAPAKQPASYPNFSRRSRVSVLTRLELLSTRSRNPAAASSRTAAIAAGYLLCVTTRTPRTPRARRSARSGRAGAAWRVTHARSPSWSTPNWSSNSAFTPRSSRSPSSRSPAATAGPGSGADAEDSLPPGTTGPALAAPPPLPRAAAGLRGRRAMLAGKSGGKCNTGVVVTTEKTDFPSDATSEAPAPLSPSHGRRPIPF